MLHFKRSYSHSKHCNSHWSWGGIDSNTLRVSLLNNKYKSTCEINTAFSRCHSKAI